MLPTARTRCIADKAENPAVVGKYGTIGYGYQTTTTTEDFDQPSGLATLKSHDRLLANISAIPNTVTNTALQTAKLRSAASGCCVSSKNTRKSIGITNSI